MTSAAAVPSVTLNDDHTMPVIGLGVGELSDAETEESVSAALEAGYRLLDTASAYGNEAAVGRAIASSGLPRDELFVTTKLATADQGYQSSQDALAASLERLGLDYVDLYLIHWPAGEQGKYVDSWGGLLSLKGNGLTRSIGVANFHEEHLSDIVDLSFVAPVVNQIELHPLLNQAALRAVNESRGIVTEAYGPLGVGRLLDNPTIVSVAEAHGKSPAQALDPVEHPVGQHRHPAFVVAGAGEVEPRRVRLRADRRRDGHAQRSRRRHPVPSGSRNLHRHLGAGEFELELLVRRSVRRRSHHGCLSLDRVCVSRFRRRGRSRRSIASRREPDVGKVDREQ